MEEKAGNPVQEPGEDVVKPLSDNDIREEFNELYRRLRNYDQALSQMLSVLNQHRHADGKVVMDVGAAINTFSGAQGGKAVRR